MKSRILLLAAVAIGVSSCSTMYKSGQTPDDLYYSPAPQQRIANNNNDDDGYSDNQSNQEYVNVQTDQDRTAYNSDDNYLRMKVRNRAMWSAFDDYAMYDAMYSPYYGGSGFSFGLGYNPYGFYSPFSSFYSPYSYYYGGLGWGGLYGYNSFYNPYFYNPYYGYGYGGSYYPGAIYGGKGSSYTRPANSYAPRTYNLTRYGSRPANSESVNGRNAPVRVFRNNNNTYVNPGNSSGSTSPRRSYNSGSNDRPVRTFDQPSRSSSSSPSYTPSSSGSRSSGGGSAPSRSPGRGGR